MSTVPESLRSFKPDSLPLTVQLAQQGYANGAPPHVTVYSVAVDAWTSKNMACSCCGKRAMTYKAFRRGASYRAVAVCKTPGCGGQEEV